MSDEQTGNFEDWRELRNLLEERCLSNWERRRRRWKATWDRFRAEGGSMASALERARLGAELSRDECILTPPAVFPTLQS